MRPSAVSDIDSEGDEMTPGRSSSTTAVISVFILIACFLIQSPAQTTSKAARNTSTTKTKTMKGPSAKEALDASESNAADSEMRPIIEYYVVDRGSLLRSFPVSSSPARRERFRKFYGDALERIQKLNFDSMSQEGKVDYLLFKNHLEHELRQLDIEEKQQAEIAFLIPFSKTIVDLEEARRRMEPIDSAKTAASLTSLKKQIDDTRKLVEAGLRAGAEGADVIKAKKTVAFRAIGAINNLKNNLRNWYTFYNGYDPLFTWWNEEPYKTLDQTLTTYGAFLGERVVGLRAEGTRTNANAPTG